ncbi:MAG TPA: hypothetical protein VKJ01_27990, partial [Candidatus Solibacter sp.]|nr:hypothetical protein [Candidatus Solibacter sp.]
GFLGSALGTPGGSNVDWTMGSTVQTAGAPGTTATQTKPVNAAPTPPGQTPTPTPSPSPTP